MSHDPDAPLAPPSAPGSAAADELDGVLRKLKLLEFGLYGLQQLGRTAPVDAEDLGPFYRLAEEIGSDLAALKERLLPSDPPESAA
jgi:hypothetical protein